MSNEHVLYHKKKLCHTEVGDFTDFQGIGSDPLYKRFESVKAVMRTSIDDRYKGFLAQPVFNADEDKIDWYADEWNEYPRRFTDLTGEELERYRQIKDETVRHYRNAVTKLEDEDLVIMGGALKYIPDETIFCYDDKVVLVAWGMCYDSNKHLDLGSLMYNVPKAPELPKQFQVCFDAGGPGVLKGQSIWKLQEGDTITAEMVPAVTASEGYSFTGWDSDPVGLTVNGDLLFTAQYERIAPVVPPPVEEPKKEEPVPEYYEVRFLDGGSGVLEGRSVHSVIAGSSVTPNMIPRVKPKRRYKFIGWDREPSGYIVNGNTAFTAQYERKKSWFAAIWPWLWKILLALLILLLLLLLLRYCKRSTPIVSDQEVPVPSHGDVEITMHWENENDMDLHCIEPSGEEISYQNRHSRTGGQLEIDMNAEVSRNHPFEHIYWPSGRAPVGTYTVKVEHFSRKCSQNNTPFTVTVKYGDKTETYPGSLSEDENTTVCSFTFTPN